MRVLIALLILISSGPLWADAADASLPGADQRAIRELQSRFYGSPTLPVDSPRQEGLLALAEMGAQAAGANEDKTLQSEDYAALLALLQRYRDELLKMGMDGTELQAQLTILEARTQELEDRLKNLKPRDGLKIFGRFYSAFDDLHILGPGTLPGPTNPSSPPGINGITPGSWGKLAGVGTRDQIGVVHGELKLQGTRGPASGIAQIDVVEPWGAFYQADQLDVRWAEVEYRTPVVLEIGDVNASLTPLTLWRDDEYEPLEPSFYAERRQRMEADLLLEPNAWKIEGMRASTDALLFNSVTLHLTSISSIAAESIGAGASGVFFQTSYVTAQTTANPNGQTLFERYNTYMQGWQAVAPFMDKHLNLGYQGLVFFDVSSTAPFAPPPGTLRFMPLNEFVQTGSVGYASDHFSLNAEGGASSYQAPYQFGTPQAVWSPLTGTALTADMAWTGDSGHFKVYGRMVTSGYHASGAQGRTVDWAYQYLGPFLNENNQVGAAGLYGLNGIGQGGIPLSDASRLNAMLVPPGVLLPKAFTNNMNAPAGGIWQNLLAFEPGEEIDPYGAATPNREGGGAEYAGKWFHAGLNPFLSAEMANEIDKVANLSGATINPFSMTRFRAGLGLDLEPWLNWPLRFGGGATLTSSSNGQDDPAKNPYKLSTTTSEASAQWNAGKPVGAQLAYEKMTVTGEDETFSYLNGGESWDTLGFGVWWRPSDAVSLDLMSSVGHTTVPGTPSRNLEVDQNVARLTLEF